MVASAGIWTGKISFSNAEFPPTTPKFQIWGHISRISYPGNLFQYGCRYIPRTLSAPIPRRLKILYIFVIMRYFYLFCRHNPLGVFFLAVTTSWNTNKTGKRKPSDSFVKTHTIPAKIFSLTPDFPPPHLKSRIGGVFEVFRTQRFYSTMVVDVFLKV